MVVWKVWIINNNSNDDDDDGNGNVVIWEFNII